MATSEADAPWGLRWPGMLSPSKHWLNVDQMRKSLSLSTASVCMCVHMCVFNGAVSIKAASSVPVRTCAEPEDHGHSKQATLPVSSQEALSLCKCLPTGCLSFLPTHQTRSVLKVYLNTHKNLQHFFIFTIRYIKNYGRPSTGWVLLMVSPLLPYCQFTAMGICWGNVKLAAIAGEQGEMEERERPLRRSRWQVSQARELTYKACPGQATNEEISAPISRILEVHT